MSALTCDTPRIYELGDINQFLVADSTIIYEGAAISINNLGQAKPLVGGEKFVGFAEQQVDNQLLFSDRPSVRVKSLGKVALLIANINPSDVGKVVFASSDNTFTLVAEGASPIGYVYRVQNIGLTVVAFNSYITT